MQIRVGNRQDEHTVRTIIENVYAEAGLPPLDLTGADADLNNVDANYFWYDGIFIVAEEDGEIIGFAGARRGAAADELELLRLLVVPSWRQRGVGRRLIDTVRFFAENGEYKVVVWKNEAVQKINSSDGARWLGFVEDAPSNRWMMPVQARVL